jgi:DNA polymerase-1
MPKSRPGPEQIGSLLSQCSPDTGWRAPEALPYLDSRFKRVGFDIESDGVEWYGRSLPVGYSLALEDGRRFYLPVRHRGGGNLDLGLVKRYCNAELRGKTLVTTGGKFDLQMSRKDGIDLESLGCTIRENQYACALLSDVRRSFSVEDMSQDFLGKGKLDLDRSRIWELPSYEVGPYAEEDAALNLQLDDYFTEQIRKEELDAVLKLENELIFCVCEMERNGAPVNMELLKTWRKRARERVSEIIYKVQTGSGLRVNPNSSGDLAALFGLLNLQYPRTEASPKFPNGQPSFPDSFLRTVRHPLVQLLREARTLDSLESKYLGKYEDGTVGDLLFYQLHQLKSNEYGTISGRFSSSALNNGKVGCNIQQVFDPERQAKKMGYDEAVESGDYTNVPYLVRNLFCPRPNRVWFKADASQIEFRLFVHYSGSERLIRMYHEAYDEMRRNPGARDLDFHKVVADICRISRKDGKNINFGMLYGMGKDKMSFQLGRPRFETDAMYQEYNERFPETRTLMDTVMSVAKRRGYVRTILGRRARFPEGERLHSALNRVIQGSAADVMKTKLKDVYNRRKELGLTMRFTVHDELDGDLEDSRMELKVKEVLEAPMEGIPLKIPLVWTTKVGDCWGAC